MCRIFDMGNDRYIVIYRNNSVRTMSHNATSPSGVCQWVSDEHRQVAKLKGREITIDDVPDGTWNAIQRDLEWV